MLIRSIGNQCNSYNGCSFASLANFLPQKIAIAYVSCNNYPFWLDVYYFGTRSFPTPVSKNIATPILVLHRLLFTWTCNILGNGNQISNISSFLGFVGFLGIETGRNQIAGLLMALYTFYPSPQSGFPISTHPNEDCEVLKIYLTEWSRNPFVKRSNPQIVI